VKKYNIGDLILLTEKSCGTLCTGIILSLNKDEYWLGGGYYIINWAHPQIYSNRSDSKEVSYTLLNTWVEQCIAKVYPVRR
jgi:hypothetical protein